MSNEYNDWCWDAAQDYLLENNLLKKIEGIIKYNDGYLITGFSNYNEQETYFVWLDDIDGWSYRQIYV